jgi:hypothetical protein
MATDKKHIAVYLDPAVEQALTEFCTASGLESKKGPMYSAAVNKALAQFFEVESTTPNKLPSTTSNTIPSDIPDNWEQRIAEIIKPLRAELKAELKAEILGESAA